MEYSRYPSNVRMRSNGWRVIWFGLAMLGIGAVTGGIGSIFIFIRITGGTAAPSAPISAPTLSLEILSTSSDPSEVFTPNSPTAMPTLVAGAAVTEVSTISTSLPSQLFRIVSEESEARFAVSETVPVGTAVGRTNQVAGDIIVDFNNPSKSRIGLIRINLRTLRTDDPDRDRSIRCCVLLSAQASYEFSEFIPTSISGLPELVQIGQEVAIKVTGDLTLRGTTRTIVFDVLLTIVSTNELRGLGRTIVNRSEFGILNDADNMFDYHGVAEAVTLEFEFVARAVQQ